MPGTCRTRDARPVLPGSDCAHAGSLVPRRAPQSWPETGSSRPPRRSPGHPAARSPRMGPAYGAAGAVSAASGAAKYSTRVRAWTLVGGWRCRARCPDPSPRGIRPDRPGPPAPHVLSRRWQSCPVRACSWLSLSARRSADHQIAPRPVRGAVGQLHEQRLREAAIRFVAEPEPPGRLPAPLLAVAADDGRGDPVTQFDRRATPPGDPASVPRGAPASVSPCGGCSTSTGRTSGDSSVAGSAGAAAAIPTASATTPAICAAL